MVHWNSTDLGHSPAEYREEARRLRAIATTLTTPALRQTLLDAAVTYDKLANRRSARSGRTLPFAPVNRG